MKHIISFKGTSDIKEFAEAMNSFTPDVNLYFGHQVFDAKSIICLMSLQLFKTYEVELVSNNSITQYEFAEAVSKFGG